MNHIIIIKLIDHDKIYNNCIQKLLCCKRKKQPSHKYYSKKSFLLLTKTVSMI